MKHQNFPRNASVAQTVQTPTIISEQLQPRTSSDTFQAFTCTELTRNCAEKSPQRNEIFKVSFGWKASKLLFRVKTRCTEKIPSRVCLEKKIQRASLRPMKTFLINHVAHFRDFDRRVANFDPLQSSENCWRANRDSEPRRGAYKHPEAFGRGWQ